MQRVKNNLEKKGCDFAYLKQNYKNIMPEVDSIMYPLISAVIVIIVSFLIRVGFHKNKPVNMKPEKRLSGKYNERALIPLSLVTIALALYAAFHIYTIVNKYASSMKPIFIFMGAWVFMQLLIAILRRPKKLKITDDCEDKYISEKYYPIVIIPVYNEDKTSLRELLESLFDQVVLPKEIHIVDDGSKEKYNDIKTWFSNKAKEMAIYTTWNYQQNQGKREAHVTAFNKIKNNDGKNRIILTVDSDGYLDKNAIKEGLIPFEDPEVYSVGGLMNAKNAQKNVLSRITDLIFLTTQLIDRNAMSVFGSVLVNSGALAFYRYEVVDFAIKEAKYSEETFFGSKVVFSDDSFLTFMANRFGKTVIQPTAIVFADMPITLSHHLRQQLRWAKGQFIRGWWRFKYLDIISYGWFRHLIGQILFFMSLTIVIQLLIIKPIITGHLPSLDFLLIPVFLAYTQGIRYFAIKRTDMTNSSRLLTYLISPLAVIWFALVIRIVTLYGYVTAKRTGWGTRQQVEIVHKK